ncbi:hypothetical protein FJV76_14550 [Mesorhizobium sp. WSM4303]|uniref:hypothetical protein n=1 Tax=unclassified Mesorhizobium TaxID=325217 RepID=UPI00115CC741|nr:MULTISPECIES: hypothetical protein [unclassified Mesorhizobium]TRC94801.1 hypothetical protein FJV77_17640 [Mesorhizobium sp. WSM4306]TRD03848.1 hypothetical protein FJV76_14550 [Mesorhizobium sp. WSM4303]
MRGDQRKGKAAAAARVEFVIGGGAQSHVIERTGPRFGFGPDLLYIEHYCSVGRNRLNVDDCHSPPHAAKSLAASG